VRLEIGYKRFTDGKNRTHFLLAGSTLIAKASMEDGSTVEQPAARQKGPDVAFTLDLTPALLPKRLTRLELIYTLNVTLDGRNFQVLDIRQVFIPMPVAATSVPTANYLLTPAGWRDSQQRLRVSNAATHPLIDTSKLASNKIQLATVMLDLTDGWAHLHRNNDTYKRYALRSAGSNLDFKVFCYLGGAPLIWYSVVPRHLQGASEVSAHVFFSAADNAIAQNNANDDAYLRRNAPHFETDGSNLFRYILPPIEDVRVAALKPQIPIIDQRRNVVGFKRVTNKQGGVEISTSHWNIGAGLQKAFMNAGSGRPAQFLLLPQRMGSTGWAITAHLKPATDAVIDLLQSNTPLLTGAADIAVAKGKMVLSCYSESGVDLWYASRANQEHLKAIIAIEPQALNTLGKNDYRKRDKDTKELVDPKEPPAPLGKEVIPELLKRNVKVFIIGRHHSPKYKPDITEIARVRLLPRDPKAIFAYPPNPAANDFIKYRVHRMIDPPSDPFMLPEETTIIQDLASKGITGLAALKVIFHPGGNDDNSDLGAIGVDQWYSHHYALTGGEEMKLDPSGIYNKPVTYRTFFQAAVQEIG
jgi:hypothetical protein